MFTFSIFFINKKTALFFYKDLLIKTLEYYSSFDNEGGITFIYPCLSIIFLFFTNSLSFDQDLAIITLKVPKSRNETFKADLLLVTIVVKT